MTDFQFSRFPSTSPALPPLNSQPPTLNPVRHALRSLAKSPGFTTVSVLTLALAIGVNSATFSFVRDLFLRPLVRDTRQHLVSLYTRREAPTAGDRDFRRFTFREFAELRANHAVLADVAATLFGTGAFGPGEHAQRNLFCLVSENYFSLLGAQPWRGRFFSAGETRPNAGIPVAVASYAYWQRLGAPADLVGRRLKIDGRDYTVVGIAPPGFAGLHVAISPAVWLPLGAAPLIPSGLWGDGPSQDLQDARSYRLLLFATLQPNLSLAAARTLLGPLEARLTALSGAGADARRLVIAPPGRFSLSNDRPEDESFLPRFAALSLGMAASVLLVACLNLANLLLARGLARRREIAIRLSLGASRGRVVRQLLTEGLLLALAGGALGVLLSAWIGDLLQQFQAGVFSAGTFMLSTHAPVDVSSLAAMAALCLAATLGFSLVPALRATKLDLVADLKLAPAASSAAASGWTRFFSLGHCLVMGQIALALMLLFGAGLFFRGAWNAGHLDYGFTTEGELVASIDYRLGHTPPAEIPRREQALLACAAALPGVTHAAIASGVPYNFEGNYRRVFAADAPTGEAGRTAVWTIVSHDYFRTLGIALLRGREFTAGETTSDRGPRVAIVDDTLARALFGDRDPIGQRLAFRAGDAAGGMEIVGVIRSPREEVFDAAAPMRIYQPLGQAPEADIHVHVAVASPAAAPAVLADLRRELHALDPENAVLSARPLGDFVTKNINLSLIHLAAIAFGAFGGVSLLLTVVGVYGVKAHAVSRRTREIGIRLALGAQRRDLLVLLLKQGMLQTALGLIAGLALALLAGGLLSKMLYRVSPVDPLALVGAAAVIALAALLACWLPARRATKVSPLIALRAE